MTTFRDDLNTAQYYIQIQEALQELPPEVLENLSEIHNELRRLDEATLSGEQIGQVFANLAQERGEGGDMTKLAAKLGPALQGAMDKIMNSKAAGILQKVGNAVPIEKLGNFVKKLPDPAGSKASAILATIQSGAEQIENDEDLAAFKGLMLTVITMGMGAAGVGGPAILGVISTAAVFRTVVNAAIKAAAGGTVKDIAKGAALDIGKAAAAALAGMAISKLADAIKDTIQGDENLASFNAQAEIPNEEMAQAATQADPDIEIGGDEIAQQVDGQAEAIFAEAPTDQVTEMLDNFNVSEAYAAKMEQMMADGTTLTNTAAIVNVQGGSSLGVLFNADEFAQYNDIIAQNGGGMDGIFSQAATDFRNGVAQAAGVAVKAASSAVDGTEEMFDSLVHPEWVNILSEELGTEFDEIVESVGPEVAVFATLTWYNGWVKENQPIIEGMEYLQKYQLVENVEHAITEAPSFGDIAKKVGGAYRQATGKVGGAVGGVAKAVAGAAKKAGGQIKQAAGGIGGVLGKMLMPIMKTGPVKQFTNKVQQITGTQGPIDVDKLSSAHASQGSPTDTDELNKFLSQEAGATKGEIDAAYKAAGVQAEAPPDDKAEPGEQPQADDKAEPGEQPQAGGNAEPGEQPQAGDAQQPAQGNAQQGSAQGAQGQQSGAQGTTSGAAGGSAGGSGAIGKGVQQAQGGQAGTGAEQPEIKVGTTAVVNKIKHKWDGKNWIGPTGEPATGLMQQELMKSQGLDIAGTAKKPGMMQRAKDYISGKTPGLAQTTRSDPKSSLARKAMGVAGAAIGGALAGGKPGEPAQAPAGEPAQAPAGEPAQAPGKEKAPGQFKQAHVPGSKGETQDDPYELAKQALRKETDADANKKQLPGGKLPPAAGKKVSDMLARLANGDKDAGAIAGRQILAYAKQGYDVSNAAQVFLAKSKQGERFLNQESYQYWTQMLESYGLTWNDIGITVRIDESVQEGVFIIANDLLRIKQLAGV